MPLGSISTTGARQLDGTLTVASIRALPFFEIGTEGVVNAAVFSISLPQYSAASTVVTGPGLPSSGMIRPRMLTRTWPFFCSAKKPRLSFQGAPPAVTPCSIGSLGTLGASDVFSRNGSGVATALPAVSADPASAAVATSAAATRLEIRITCLLVGRHG